MDTTWRVDSHAFLRWRWHKKELCSLRERVSPSSQGLWNSERCALTRHRSSRALWCSLVYFLNATAHSRGVTDLCILLLAFVATARRGNPLRASSTPELPRGPELTGAMAGQDLARAPAGTPRDSGSGPVRTWVRAHTHSRAKRLH